MRILPVMLALSLAACKSSCGGSPAEATPKASADAAAPVVAGAGKAYIGTTGDLVVVDDGVMKSVTGTTNVTCLSLAPDDVVYGCGTPLVRVRDLQATETPVTTIAAAVGPDGRVWTPDSERVQIIQGDAAEQIAGPDPHTYHVAVTKDGTAFAGSENDVFRREGEGWKKEDLSAHFGDRHRLLGLVTGPAGELYVVDEDGVVRRDASGAWHKIDLGLLPGVFGFGAVSGKGTLPLWTRSGVRLVDSKGNARAFTADTAKTLTAIAVDDAERVWIGAHNGLFIFAGDGKLLQQWPVGALPGLVESLAIRGAGPKLPDVAPKAVSGSLQGMIHLKGKPLARARIEMCPVPTFGETPCASAAVHVATTTDEHGAFTLADVPRQRYRLAYEVNGAWKFTPLHDKSCCEDLTASSAKDLGTIELP